MAITALVAVLLGAGRALVPWLGEELHLDRESPIFIFLALSAVIQTLPLLLAGLLPRWSLLGVIVVLLLIGLATTWEVSLLRHFPGVRGSGPNTRHFIWINVFTSAVILAGILLVRFNGYGTRPRECHDRLFSPLLRKKGSSRSSRSSTFLLADWARQTKGVLWIGKYKSLHPVNMGRNMCGRKMNLYSASSSPGSSRCRFSRRLSTRSSSRIT